MLGEYGCIHPIFYISYLHPHVGPVPTHLPPPLLLNDAAAGEFKVEDSLDSHLGHYGTKYFVKWLGYPVFEAAMKPDKHLANSPNILH